MSHQAEQPLENNLVKQLVSLGHSYIELNNEADILANLKVQLEKHNQIKLSDSEFDKVLNHLNKGNIFERAKILRDKMQFTSDDGETKYIEFINQDQWCQNEFQVTKQVTVEGTYTNRYDVTILINGLPLVQIELKRRGLELKEAFNQINRYQRHSFGASYGLFQYVQLFVISNGVNTKYYANNKNQSFKQTFYWSDTNNSIITQLEAFTELFLEPCHLAKMITNYIVLNEAEKVLMVLRPYQYYATEAIIERVKNSPKKNGYIWHTTGSGKTLTSFKASQILINIPKVYKVVFVVDRQDLDFQTIKEFNAFSKGSVDGTDNTNVLVSKFTDETKLIVTTLQKLNVAISKTKYLHKMENLKDKRIIFIFDECHRSQFGDTHKKIKAFFTNQQMFGFTGTPIFADNAANNEGGRRTTKDLFEECLHKYVINDAIKDENVLRFLIEYVGKYKNKNNSNNFVDIEVEDIDTKELLDSPERLKKIVDYIIANHDRKTHSKVFNAIFCVSSIDTLIKYYDLFQEAKVIGRHNLKIATIFSFGANEDDKDANGSIPESNLDITDDTHINLHTRDKLEQYIGDYNLMFNSKYTTKDSKSFYNYFTDISKNVKERKIDILLVVNMFLTGFDSKHVNTLYVDKNLKYHGLIQAYSRTNRILNEQKSQGNIISFRNLKKATDDAIALFSNKNANEVILVEPYEDYVSKFNRIYKELIKKVPTVDSVNSLLTEKDELGFIQTFRELLRVRNVLTTFADFSYEDLSMDAQSFEDYKSKYLDLYDKVRSTTAKEKVSILNDVDFELELIHRDDINVSYILGLLIKLSGKNPEEQKKERKAILNLVNGETELRSKKELIEKFIEQNMPQIQDNTTITEQFEKFWSTEKQQSFEKLCTEEKLDPIKLQEVISKYLFNERKPVGDDVFNMLQEKPKLLQRKKVIDRVWDKVTNYVKTFIDGIDDVE
jgi:type I restriction enzyme R subunit